MRTQTKYGVDVAVTRADDLDKKMILDVATRVNEGHVPAILDLGCGGGGQSVRLAAVGASVVGVDVVDHSALFSVSAATEGFSEGVVRFIVGEMSQLDTVLGAEKFDCVCLQRVLHYLPYAIAAQVLCGLHARLLPGGKLYIAVTGLESAIGLGYADADVPIVDRFCRLNTINEETFSITEPLCLYTPEECIALLQESGWKIDECWVSAFGNIKAICS